MVYWKKKANMKEKKMQKRGKGPKKNPSRQSGEKKAIPRVSSSNEGEMNGRLEEEKVPPPKKKKGASSSLEEKTRHPGKKGDWGGEKRGALCVDPKMKGSIRKKKEKGSPAKNGIVGKRGGEGSEKGKRVCHSEKKKGRRGKRKKSSSGPKNRVLHI